MIKSSEYRVRINKHSPIYALVKTHIISDEMKSRDDSGNANFRES